MLSLLSLLNVLNPSNSHILYVYKIKRCFILCKTKDFESSEYAELAELIQSYFTKPPKEYSTKKGYIAAVVKAPSRYQLKRVTADAGRKL